MGAGGSLKSDLHFQGQFWEVQLTYVMYVSGFNSAFIRSRITQYPAVSYFCENYAYYGCNYQGVVCGPCGAGKSYTMDLAAWQVLLFLCEKFFQFYFSFQAGRYGHLVTLNSKIHLMVKILSLFLCEKFFQFHFSYRAGRFGHLVTLNSKIRLLVMILSFFLFFFV